MYSRKVGLLGGTFDPPHIGHLVTAIHVKKTLELDEVRLVVANHPWQKEGSRQITSSEQRLAMATAAAQACDVTGIETTDVELVIGGPSYMVNTLQKLEADEPDTDFLTIVGADAAADLDTWHEAERLKALAKFIFVNRPGYPAPDLEGWSYETVQIPPIDLSSSDIRTMVLQQKPLSFLTPLPVIQHIEALGLYRLE